MIAALLLAAAAGAASLLPAPATNVDNLHPVVEAPHGLATVGVTQVAPVVVGADVGLGHGLLVGHLPDGTPVPVLSDALTLGLGVAWQPGRVGLALDAPLVLFAQGEQGTHGPMLGDLGVRGRLVVLDRTVGLAVIGRLGLPTGNTDWQLGETTPTGELGLAAQVRVLGFRLGANVVADLRPEVATGAGAIGHGIGYRAVLGRDFGDRATAWAEVSGRAPFSALATPSPNVVPVELLGGGSVQLGAVRLRAGVGGGVTAAVGSAAVRAVVGVAR